MNTIMEYFGLFCLVVGLLLDILTIVWSFKHALGGKYRSGNFIVPLVLYLVFTFTSSNSFVRNNRILLVICAVIIHFSAYFIIPVLLDKIFGKNKSSS